MAQHLITTKAKLLPCRRCGAALLHGWSEGLYVKVNLVPIPDATTLIAVLVTGRHAYKLARGELLLMDQHRIAGNLLPGPMLATHRCGTGIALAPPVEPQPAAGSPEPDEPPF